MGLLPVVSGTGRDRCRSDALADNACFGFTATSFPNPHDRCGYLPQNSLRMISGLDVFFVLAPGASFLLLPLASYPRVDPVAPGPHDVPVPQHCGANARGDLAPGTGLVSPVQKDRPFCRTPFQEWAAAQKGWDTPFARIVINCSGKEIGQTLVFCLAAELDGG